MCVCVCVCVCVCYVPTLNFVLVGVNCIMQSIYTFKNYPRHKIGHVKLKHVQNPEKLGGEAKTNTFEKVFGLFGCNDLHESLYRCVDFSLFSYRIFIKHLEHNFQ